MHNQHSSYISNIADHKDFSTRVDWNKAVGHIRGESSLKLKYIWEKSSTTRKTRTKYKKKKEQRTRKNNTWFV